MSLYRNHVDLYNELIVGLHAQFPNYFRNIHYLWPLPRNPRSRQIYDGGTLCTRSDIERSIPYILRLSKLTSVFVFCRLPFAALCRRCFLCETVRKSSPRKEIVLSAANIENSLSGSNGVHGANGGKIENGKHVTPSDKQFDDVVVEQSNEHHYFTLPSEERFLRELAKSVNEEANGSGNCIVDIELTFS